MGTTLAALALTISLAGCGGSSVDLDDQREVMLEFASRVVSSLERVGLDNIVVVDDGADVMSCPDGERYEYIIFGQTAYAASETIDDRLDLLETRVWASIGPGRDFPDPEHFVFVGRYDQEDDVEARRYVFHVADGDHSGVEITVELLPRAGDTTLIRVDSTTACG